MIAEGSRNSYGGLNPCFTIVHFASFKTHWGFKVRTRLTQATAYVYVFVSTKRTIHIELIFLNLVKSVIALLQEHFGELKSLSSTLGASR